MKAALAIHGARTAATIGISVNPHISNKEIVYYTPNVVKLWLGGKRGAKKDELLSGLKSTFPQYNYDLLKEDEIDALALALYHLREVQIDTNTTVSGTKRRRVSKRA
jgi:Holliday junction resolvasome RuvABC endonuclease subunit